MKSKKRSFRTHGNESKTKKASKHDANLKNNSALHFQIGLLISLLITFFVLQIAFRTPPPHEDGVAEIIYEDEIFVIEPKIIREKQPQEEVKKSNKKPVLLNDTYVKIDNDELNVVKNDIITPEQPTVDTNLNAGNITYEEKEMPIGPIDFVKVEKVPIFPGCESLTTNEERKQCMSEKIDRIVRKNFRTDKAVDYGLSGRQKIYVQFKIDKQGLVSDVKVRAPHKVLEEEAKRVTSLIPQMKPGRQRNQDVEVVFLKPIIFKTE